MYSNSEIKIIVANCETSGQLLYACQLFRMLILFGDLKKSAFLERITHLRFRELQILGK